MARVELGALTALRNIVHQHQHLRRADEIDVACERQFLPAHAYGAPKVVVQIDGSSVSVLTVQHGIIISPGACQGGTFIHEKLCLCAESVREIVIAGIVLELHAEHRAMSLGKRIDRLGDVDVITSCKVVRLRTGAAVHALVGVIGIDPDLSHAVHLLNGVEAAIAICAIDRFAHTAARLSPCRELVGGKRTEVVAAKVIDHIVEAKVAVVAIFRRSEQLEVVGKHHPGSPCCIHNLVLPHANAKLRLSEWLEPCLFAQSHIDGHGIALLVGIYLAMLVVLHDVHLSGIFGRDILRGKIVAASKHVETAYVEAGDVLAHVADGTVIRNADAWQILQSVFECHITFLEESCKVV